MTEFGQMEKMEVDLDSSSMNEAENRRERNYLTILKDLETAEDHLERIMGVATETIDQLLEFPLCDYEQIRKRTQEYTDRLKSVYKLIHQNSDILEIEPVVNDLTDVSVELSLLEKAKAELEEEERRLYPDIVINEFEEEKNDSSMGQSVNL